MAKRHRIQIILAPVFYLFSLFYGLAMIVRERLYHFKFINSYLSKHKVVCVGNISWGGTGKSPIVNFLAEKSKQNQKNPLILTRGYGKKYDNYPIRLNRELVKNKGIDYFPDEPLMLLKQHDLEILIDPKRSRAAKALDNNLLNLDIDYIIMDDGFSHLALKRSIDLVLLDKDDLIPRNSRGLHHNNWNKVIPYGTWREPFTALKRANAFLLKCPKNIWENEFFQNGKNFSYFAKNKLEKYKKPLFIFEMEIFGYENLWNKESWDYSNQQNYVLICALANPKQLLESIYEYFSLAPINYYFFNDHYDFQNEESLLAEILNNYPIICTEKDAVKLEKFVKLQNCKYGIYVIRSKTVFHNSLFFDKLSPINSNNCASDFDIWLEENNIL